MNPLVLSEFINFFPELASIAVDSYNSTALRAIILSRRFEGMCDDDEKKLAVALLTAHMLKLNDVASCNGGNGIIRSVRSKEDSITFGVPSDFADFKDWLRTTSYGNELLFILDSYIPAGFLI